MAKRKGTNTNKAVPSAKRTKRGSEIVAVKTYNDKVAVYFDQSRFFGADWKRDIFQQSAKHWVKDEKKPNLVNPRETTAHDLYMEALQTYKDDHMKLKIFFLNNITSCDDDAVLKDFYQWKKKFGIASKDSWVTNPHRMVNVDFHIQDTHLSQRYDLTHFSRRMQELFLWYTKKDRKKEHVAPYFCFIQSSGMGKTKLMYEYKKKVAPDTNVQCVLILPSDMKFDKKGTVFQQLDLLNIQPDASTDDDDDDAPTEDNNLKHSREVAERIFCVLDEFLKTLEPQKREAENECQKIALLFDESHALLKKEFGLEAFRFRCVRLWLREKRQKFHVVAVFAGTNSRFVNFLFETDEELKNFVYPSRVPTMPPREYHRKGAKLYEPFHITMTMGSCLQFLKEAEQNKGQSLSDYERAVYYGRPLFALMAKEGKLDESLTQVLRRMLLVNSYTEDTWTESRRAWISLLSTRVQMGQTTTELASDLVACSYATFCGYFSPSRAIRVGHNPDPVCARLAMCLMDESFRIEEPDCKIGNGRNKEWWTGKLREIFSTGIVSPEKGNFGEVVVALYMLFCGDLLRERINREKEFKGVQLYSQFSVSLDAWLHLMKAGGKTTENVPMEECTVSVGFIQVCRNSLRSYRKSWASLADQSFLKHIFESGIAFYVFPNCPIIDVVIPLRITQGTETEYVPMFVSIKCREKFTYQEVAAECKAMKHKASLGKLKKALCLLVIFASKPTRKKRKNAKPKPDGGTNAQAKPDGRMTYELENGEKISDLLSRDGVVARAIRVPLDDAFKLNEAFMEVTPAADIRSDFISAHTFLMAHGHNDKYHEDLNAGDTLRDGSRARFEEDYSFLKEEMREKKRKDAPPA